MRRNQRRSVWLGASTLAVLIASSTLSGQAVPDQETAIPVPTDWSHRHVIFSKPATTEQARRVEKDPRYWQQRYRSELPAMPLAESREALASDLRTSSQTSGLFRKQGPGGDWQESLGSGASVGAGNYPAKFSFHGTTAYCGNATQPDFVVYSTGLPGSTGQASIVAYDNLYSGCIGTVPSIYWAYNTSGQILTSPAFSRDGKQVAFVETNGGFGILVLLKWAASTSETVSSPDTLTAVGNGAYRACIAPCMTTINLMSGSGTQTDDTTSSIFVDISADTGWVGGAGGWLHKITGLFLGTPAEVTAGAGPFPVQVNSGNVLSSPVHDFASGNVYVGDAGGFIYAVNSSTAAVTQSAKLDFGVGIVQGPIVDPTRGFVYAFASSDGSAACTGGAACTAIYQLSTNFAAGATGSKVKVGTSTVFTTGPNPNPLYIGSFDSAYENSIDATGNLYVCGNTGGNPILYQVPIAAGALPVTGLGTAITSLTPLARSPACSPVTDLYNANANGGPAERLFVSVQNYGRSSGCGGGGCVLNFLDTAWQPSTAYAVGQEILGSRLHIEVVMTAGTSGTVAPTWGSTAGAMKTDNTVVWIDQGALTAATLASWLPSHMYPVSLIRIVDSNGNVEIQTAGGTSGSLTPVWSTVPGANTSDGTVTWTNVGAVATFALPAAGGTSGIIIDNTVGSGTLPGASQIYFSTLSNQTCGTSGIGGCAVQASQSNLQ